MVISLQNIVSETLDIERLREMLPKRSKAILYNSLTKLLPIRRKDLFKQLDSLIVLYEGVIDKKKQGHYVVLIPRAHSIEYFSSLGRSPTDEMHALHEDNTAFKTILGKNYTYNRRRVQLDSYSVEDCGYWVLARAILYKHKLPKFLKLFQPRSVKGSDEMLSIMSLLLANR